MEAEAQGTDNAQAPAPSQAETTGAGTASEQTTQQPDIAALQAQLQAATAAAQAATKAAENAARFAHARDAELARYRRQEQQQRQEPDGYQENSQQPQRDALTDRVSLIDYKLSHPNHVEKLEEMSRLTQDPTFAATYGSDLNNPQTFQIAHQVALLNDLRAKADAGQKAQAELDAIKTKQKTAQQTLKDQAFVSGMGTSDAPQQVSQAEMDGMTLEQMEKKFGKAALLRGIY